MLATLAAGAALIHFAVVPEHLEEYLPFGIAFGALGVVQVVIGAAALTGHLRLARAPALALTAGVIGVWILSRTTGLPIGPEPWHAEEIGLADVIATALEVAFIAVLGLQMLPRMGRAIRSPDLASLAVVPVVGLIGLVTLLAIAAPSAQEHGHEHSLSRSFIELG